MESAISTFCKALASFCSHVEYSTQSLSDSIHRRPIPLDSAASSFLNSLDRRINSLSADLDLLDPMASGTVSFEELIGHCHEVYKTNSKYISQIEDRLKSLGYIPELELEDGDVDGDGDDGVDLDLELLSPSIESKMLDLGCGSVSAARLDKKKIDEGLLCEDSLFLKNLGLSDACLATLASEDNDCPARLPMPSYSENAIRSDDSRHTKSASSFRLLIDVSTASDNDCPATMPLPISSAIAIRHDDSEPQRSTSSFQPPIDVSIASEGGIGKPNTVIQILKDEYDGLPSYMKNLASWEELQEAVVKLNDCLRKKEEAMECAAVNQNDLEALGLGHKGRSYLLLLLRMKQVFVETVDGATHYRATVS